MAAAIGASALMGVGALGERRPDDRVLSEEEVELRGVNDLSMPQINDSWFGRPVEEVDPLILDDTFCVISNKYNRHFIYRFSATKSLFLLGPLNPIRKFAVYLTTHRWFDVLIILTIVANCVTLAMITNEYDKNEEALQIIPEHDFYIDRIEYAFLAIYTLELVLKVISKGLVFNKFSYLRNRWNILDFIVVTSGYVTIVADWLDESNTGKKDNELEFLRTFRVLRAVKTLSILPGLRMMINALLSSVVHLLEVMALTTVCLMIFSLFALEVFQGTLHQKCVIDKGGPADPFSSKLISQEPDEDRDRIWTEWVTNSKNWKQRDFPSKEPTQCGNTSGTRLCGPGFTCIAHLGENPNNDWTSFDNFLMSMLSTFQLLTLDFWERLYDLVVSTCGMWSLLFFMLVIFLGAYYLLNLMLAVVAMSYENEAQLQEQGPISYSERLAGARQNSNFSFDDLSKLNICKMTFYRKRTNSERAILARKLRLSGHNDEDDLSGNRINLGDAIFSMMGIRMALGKDEEKKADSQSSITNPALADPQSEIVHLKSVDPTIAEEEGRSDGSRRSQAELGDLEEDLVPTPSTVIWKHKLGLFLKRTLTPVVNHWTFDIVITICIILNTILLAMEHHGESKEMDDWLRIGNHFFMAMFTAECIIKSAALQKEYFRSGWNKFDLTIVIISYIDLALVVDSGNRGGGSLSVIRSMRLLRVFKLAQSWITMKVLLNIIFMSVGALGNLTCVLLIVIYIFAVMGMQIVGGQYTPVAFGAVGSPSEFPRWNWRHFWYAFMMVFRVLCGEWIEPLWDCLHAQSKSIPPGQKQFLPYFKCFVIYLPILIVGNFIVLNLFLALLLNSFDTEELNAQREKEMEASGRAENLKNIVGILLKKEQPIGDDNLSDDVPADIAIVPAQTKRVSSLRPKDIAKPMEKVPSKDRARSLSARGTILLQIESPAKTRFKAIVKKVIMQIRKEAAERAIARAENKRKLRSHLDPRFFLRNPGMKDKAEGFHHDVTPATSEHSEKLTVPGECFPKVCLNKLCPCRTFRRRYMRKWHIFRGWCVAIVGHSAFEWTILTLIFASSITLCFEDIYLDSKPRLKQALCYLNFCFTGLFFTEMILKWFAIGLHGYFTNFWTLLDAFIVAVSLVSLYFDVTLDTCSAKTVARTGAAANLGALKALRTLRALRPLRAISRWEGMKIVVNALMYAIPSIFNVLLVCLLFWLVFAIMGVQFFKGQFFRCVGPNGDKLDPRLAPNKGVCCAKTSTHGYSWVNTVSNYDNVFEGYLSLLQVATFEGWMELMEYSVDAVGVDKQPITDHQIQYYGFYVVFIIVGSFFTLRLFIGVIIDNFNMLKKKYEGNMLEILLTPTQRNYYIAMKNLGRKKPKKVIKRPTHKVLCFFYDMAMSRNLEITIFIMIFLNMVIEAFKYDGQGELVAHMVDGTNAFFTTVYVLEAIVKLIGLRSFYFTAPWNVFDFVLVLASLMDVFLGGDLSVALPIPPTMLRIVRVFRIGRILRLVKAAKGIRKLLFALVVSLPALFNIGALLGLITFIYAILGMALFSKAPKKWSIDGVFNFETFQNSNLMLLRLMTAAGWNEVLDSLTVVEPVCGSFRHIECGMPGEPECPIRALVVAYIVSYLILTNLVVINLYIAIILENYVEASNEEDVGIVEDDLEMFYIRWSSYDPMATQFINFSELPDFLDSLDPPLGLRKPNMIAIVAFNLPIARGYKVHCLDILHALIKHVLGQVDDSPEFRKLQKQMQLKFQKQFPTRRLLDIVSTTRKWKIENNAARTIQRAWRAYKKRQNARKESEYDPNASTQATYSGHGGMGHMMNRMGNASKSNPELQDRAKRRQEAGQDKSRKSKATIVTKKKS